MIHPQYSAVGGDLKVLNQYDVALIQLSASVPFATIPYMGDASTPSNGKSIMYDTKAEKKCWMPVQGYLYIVFILF